MYTCVVIYIGFNYIVLIITLNHKINENNIIIINSTVHFFFSSIIFKEKWIIQW